MLKLANENNTPFDLALESIACSGPELEDIDGIQFHVYRLAVLAVSEVPPQLINFTFALSDAFPDATVDSLRMTLPKVAEDGTLQGSTSASLQLRVYYMSRQESPDG